MKNDYEFALKTTEYLNYILNDKNQFGENVRDYWEKCRKNGIDSYENLIDPNDVDVQIKKIKSELTEKINNNVTTKYQGESFLNSLAKLRALEAQKEKLNKIEKEEDCVKDLFGDYITDKVESKKKTNKSVEELNNERNERLAILYKMKNNHKIDDEEFVKGVVAIRRCYDRAIKDQTIIEAKQMDNVKTPKKLKDFFAKIKSAFKFGKIEKVEENKNQNFVQDNNALLALGLTADMLIEMGGKTMMQEVGEISATSVEIASKNQNSTISKDADIILSQMIEKEVENKNTSLEEKENYSKILQNQKIALTSPLNKRGEPKSKEEIERKFLGIENFLLQNNKHKKVATGNLKDGINVEIKFEDEKINAVYN